MKMLTAKLSLLVQIMRGQINFNFIEGKRPTYTNADAGKTFTYTVEEVPSNLPNINSDAMKAIVTVNVTKDLHVLTATSIVPADTEFNNTVEPPVPPTPNKPPHNPPKTPGQPPVNPPGNPPETRCATDTSCATNT